MDKIYMGIATSPVQDSARYLPHLFIQVLATFMPKSNPQMITSVHKIKKKSSEDLYKQIVELRNIEKLSYRAIAEKLGVGKSTVSNYLATWKKNVPVKEIKPNCRPPKVTPKIRSTIGQLVAKQDVPTSKQIAAELSATTGVSVTPRTVC
jgi:transposase